MDISQHVNSLFSSMSYAFGGTLLDPGDRWVGFDGVSAVLLTHAHFDHVYGLNELLDVSPQAKVYTNEAGSKMLLDSKKNMSFYHETPFVFGHPESVVVVQDGDVIELDGGVSARAVFTPGHNASCITWIVRDALFTGDSYIPGIKTVTNLPGGGKPLAAASEKLILELAQHRIIYPGHEVKYQV